ncbi:MAG: hypothetical protein AAF432_13330, partial [Planctomycetota bacterium]
GEQSQSGSQSQQGEQSQSGSQSQQGEQGESPALDEDLPQDASPEDQDIVEAQQDVRDELADLIELLDRDEDTWVVTRQLEELLEEQGRLQAATSSLGDQTLGQTAEELSQEDREALDDIAQQQEELSERVDQLTDELRDRAEALEEVDPESADGMRRAANTAEQRGLNRDMQQAGQQVEQNQMQQAQESQAAARQTLSRMLEDIEESRRAQADELLRKLASLVESIERLIVVQENEITALARSVDTSDFTGRDRAMIRLNQNTSGVADEARAAGNEARRIARLLNRAADAQGEAVSALRARPINSDRATESEERSLEQLKEAKTLAEQLEEETQEQEVRRRREEIQEKYREFIERQIGLRESAVDLAAKDELDRRDLVEARRLGVRQGELRREIAELRDTTQEILDSSVFSHTHDMIDGWAQAVADQLGNGTVDIDVTDRQMLIADSLRRLMEALEEDESEEEEFAQDSQMGGGGQQGPQPLIPPVKELKLLRGLQEQVYDQTKSLDSREDLNSGQMRDRLRDVGQRQRDLLDLGEAMLDALDGGGAPPPRITEEDLERALDEEEAPDNDTSLRPGDSS